MRCRGQLKTLFVSTRQLAMIATHVAVGAVVAVVQIATLLVQQLTSVGGVRGVRVAAYDSVALRRRLGLSQI